jgi:hypothetical protein
MDEAELHPAPESQVEVDVVEHLADDHHHEEQHEGQQGKHAEDEEPDPRADEDIGQAEGDESRSPRARGNGHNGPPKKKWQKNDGSRPAPRCKV